VAPKDARENAPENAPENVNGSTLLIIKPDGVRRSLIGEVLRRVEEAGLRIDELRMETIDRATAEEQYGEHRDKPFFAELVDFITGGPVVVAKVTGDNAISVWRDLMGPTDPADAPPGTIRGDFASVITENVVHGSDSPESAARELKLFFGE
jgi:nucleoside-diphosphate kinase